MEVGSLSANRNLLIILLMLLEIAGGVAYYIYFYRPQQEIIQQKVEVIEQKKREVREIELTKRMLEETKEEIERLKTEIAHLEKFFPEDVFVPRVLVLVENLAMATHVEIDHIRPGAAGRTRRVTTSAGGGAKAPTRIGGAAESGPERLAFNEKTEYKTSQIDFKLRGTFQNIYNFMNELATFPKLVVVDSMSLSPSGDGNSEGEALDEGGAETGREVEVGGYVELSASLPLTFYIQAKESPELKF